MRTRYEHLLNCLVADNNYTISQAVLQVGYVLLNYPSRLDDNTLAIINSAEYNALPETAVDIEKLTQQLGNSTLTTGGMLVKRYSKGKLFFSQERLVVTDMNNNVINSNDIIDLVEEIL